ncbi:hypothetical protein F5Y04DRAFT_230158 [Hypomontagnella monticulosa]|nr:hypothetical protein F5Y04DRAFT_230158 [Hypomontagnella monticulosa]
MMTTLAEIRDNGTAILVEQYWCVYPISGVYTRFQRILLYVAIAFAFLTRFHHWISSSALMYVVIYTLTAAIHAIPLSVQENLGPDPDFLATQIIVMSAFCCSVMATIYSPKIFEIDVGALYTVWLWFLVVVMWIQALTASRFINSSGLYTVDVKGGQGMSATDICSGFNPNAVFRSATDTLEGVLIDSWSTTNSSYFPDNTVVKPDRSGGYRVNVPNNATSIYLAIVLPLMIIGLTNVGRPLRVSRAIAFHGFINRRVPRPATTMLQRFAIHVLFGLERVLRIIGYLVPVIPYLVSRLWHRRNDHIGREPWHYRVTTVETDTSPGRVYRGKLVGLSWYILCILAYWIWPLFLLYVVVGYEETWFTSLPESEEPCEVGQWGPWVGFCMTGVIVLVYRVYTLREEDDKQSIGHLIWATKFGAYKPGEARAGRGWNWHRPFLVIAREWRDFKVWWRNPLEITDSGDGEPLNYTSASYMGAQGPR